jgi:hypothetical protein
MMTEVIFNVKGERNEIIPDHFTSENSIFDQILLLSKCGYT